MSDWGGVKSFDVDTSPTQKYAFPTLYAFNLGWGEQCAVAYEQGRQVPLTGGLRCVLHRVTTVNEMDLE